MRVERSECRVHAHLDAHTCNAHARTCMVSACTSSGRDSGRRCRTRGSGDETRPLMAMSERDVYSTWRSPLSTRYASWEMRHNFSEQNKFSTWRRLWYFLAKGEKVQLTRFSFHRPRDHPLPSLCSGTWT